MDIADGKQNLQMVFLLLILVLLIYTLNVTEGSEAKNQCRFLAGGSLVQTS